MVLFSFKVPSELIVVVVVGVSVVSVKMLGLHCVVDVVVMAVIFTIGGNVAKAVVTLGLAPKVEVV